MQGALEAILIERSLADKVQEAYAFIARYDYNIFRGSLHLMHSVVTMNSVTRSSRQSCSRVSPIEFCFTDISFRILEGKYYT
jgi:hypothetical protein